MMTRMRLQSLLVGTDTANFGGRNQYYNSNEKVMNTLNDRELYLNLWLLMHECMYRLAELRLAYMTRHIQDLPVDASSVLVYVYPRWREQLLAASTQCNDWTWLLKCGADMKLKAAQKAKLSQSTVDYNASTNVNIKRTREVSPAVQATASKPTVKPPLGATGTSAIRVTVEMKRSKRRDLSAGKRRPQSSK